MHLGLQTRLGLGLVTNVPFSCKGRGICSSCGGRRMAETAAHLVDHVIPRVPTRQWVLSLPRGIRYLLAYDSKLSSQVLRIFTTAVRGWYRREAKKRHALRTVKGLETGAVTAIQRFGGSLNLNVHYHSVFADGVWTDEKEPRFVEVPPPIKTDIEKLVKGVAKKTLRLLTKRGKLDDDGYLIDDALELDAPALAVASQTSIQQRDEHGRKLPTIGTQSVPPRRELDESAPVFEHVGFSMHAGAAVPKNDRKRLEHLLRYEFRPAIVDKRLSVRADGNIVVQNKTRWRDGTTHVVMTPDQFMQRLVALVPAPRANLTRYHGVFAAHHRMRAKIVPRQPQQLDLFNDRPEPDQAPAPEGSASQALLATRPQPPERYDWATLLKRVFEVDVTVCPDCGGKMKLIATITDPKTIWNILAHVGVPTESPASQFARGPPTHQLEFDIDEFEVA
jgi:hypothetical protein